MPFLAESALPLAPATLVTVTGNTQQHESIHTPLSQPALPSHTTHLSPIAALDGDGGKHTASLDVSQPYSLVQAFPHTRRHFSPNQKQLHQQERRQQRAFAIEDRGCASLSRVEFSLRVCTLALSTATIHSHTSTLLSTPNTLREQPKKKQGKTREPCSSFRCSLQRKFIPIRALVQ
jgi:hypothetical protein